MGSIVSFVYPKQPGFFHCPNMSHNMSETKMYYGTMSWWIVYPTFVSKSEGHGTVDGQNQLNQLEHWWTLRISGNVYFLINWCSNFCFSQRFISFKTFINQSSLSKLLSHHLPGGTCWNSHESNTLAPKPSSIRGPISQHTPRTTKVQHADVEKG